MEIVVDNDVRAMCDEMLETVSHIFFSCKLATWVWNICNRRTGVNPCIMTKRILISNMSAPWSLLERVVWFRSACW